LSGVSDPITWRNDTRKLRELIPWERNPRQITEEQAQRLAESLDEFGQVETLAIEPDNELVDGHQRKAVWAAVDRFGPDYEVDVRVASRKLDEREKQKLSVMLHKGATGEFDFDELANWGIEADLLDWGFGAVELGVDIDLAFPEDEEEEGEQDLAEYVPDAVWPTDNDWGVPLLDANLQARSLDAPFIGWGSVARTKRMRGTWHFYTGDYRFEALWSDPAPVVNTRCVNVIEPNFSCYNEMPMAVGLWQIYRKRWLARWWQSFGIRVFVDLNVAPKFYDLNWLGVPEGWAAYGTRGYTERLDWTAKEYEMACEHAGTDSILFVVYGGGPQIEEACKANGWLWMIETMDGGADG